MQKIIELYLFLLIAFLGFISPLTTLLMSIFSEGLKKLSDQYNSEKSQTETNIKEQIKKIDVSGQIDTKEMQANLDKLKKIKKEANFKLFYLNPQQQIINLFFPLAISFISGLLCFLLTGVWYYLCIGTSILAFFYSIFVLWTLANVMIEVSKLIHENEKDKNKEIVESLSELRDTIRKGSDTFLKRIWPTVNRKHIDDSENKITLSSEEKQKLKISIDNVEDIMAKNVEVGFIFPLDFIIEKSSGHTIYRDQTQQIVRYKSDFIQGITNQLCSDLEITPLKKETFEIKTFIKGENIKATYNKMIIEVK